MLYAKLIGRIALFTCENIAHIEFYLQGLLPKILAIYTIKTAISSFIILSLFYICFFSPGHFHTITPQRIQLRSPLTEPILGGATMRGKDLTPPPHCVKIIRTREQ